jgi:hypothetical protein
MLLSLDEGPLLETFRGMFRKQRWVMVPSAAPPESTLLLRAWAGAFGLEPFFIADRGRYHRNDTFVDDELFDALRRLAERIVEAPLSVGPPRWLRFGHGDYALTHGDATERPTGSFIELTLDFSDTETGQGAVVYTDGIGRIVLPQWPGSLALVERPAKLYRYERYLTHRVQASQIFRLRLPLGIGEEIQAWQAIR